MKNLIYLMALPLYLIGCVGNYSNTAEEESEDPQKSKFYADFLDKFEAVSFDTLAIINEEEFNKYKGKALGSLEAVLFPPKISEEYFSREQGIFALFKFPVDSSKIALIARTPSEYHPSSVKLFIYDKQSHAINEYIELANLWGDAGDLSDKVSWIFREKGKLRVYISNIETHDNSVDNKDDNTVNVRATNCHIRLTENGFDTISKDLKITKESL